MITLLGLCKDEEVEEKATAFSDYVSMELVLYSRAMSSLLTKPFAARR